MSRLIAVDPIGCGCTECMAGGYVPLNRANAAHVAALLTGRLRNHTGATFQVSADYELEPGANLLTAAPPGAARHL
ncbi:hypothetical protein OG883_17245 [Streptomyces sp. NBC_01142]|uniref:hypothetical protein n=1 Tax=Streptomyces sp. NBC_01142 TaxID=2975865 RepID=UPI00225A6E3D|nr:hypothetical protein [Streptomyces sp. NBC_01142]MCX4821604.1 hypothetical protein [Streptomyces sp. NBC_01142]